jgi:hypothetical protein
VQQVGLYGLLACTALGLTGSLWCGERAYQISEQHGFDPSLEMSKNSAKKASPNSNPAQTAARLFQEQPMLKALFMEVMSFQSLSTILNVCFVTKLKSLISNDMDRAAWTGKVRVVGHDARAAMGILYHSRMFSFTPPLVLSVG